MNFLVTGRAGFIGSALCRHLCADPSHCVTNLDSSPMSEILLRRGPSRPLATIALSRPIAVTRNGARYTESRRHRRRRSPRGREPVDRSIDRPGSVHRDQHRWYLPTAQRRARNIGAPCRSSEGRVFASVTCPPTRCSETWPSTAACLSKAVPTLLPRLMRHRRRLRTTWFETGTPPMTCPLCSPTGRTITGLFNSLKSRSRSPS